MLPHLLSLTLLLLLLPLSPLSLSTTKASIRCMEDLSTPAQPATTAAIARPFSIQLHWQRLQLPLPPSTSILFTPRMEGVATPALSARTANTIRHPPRFATSRFPGCQAVAVALPRRVVTTPRSREAWLRQLAGWFHPRHSLTPSPSMPGEAVTRQVLLLPTPISRCICPPLLLALLPRLVTSWI